jgi:AcrR family transcriptional regulator
MVVNVYYCRMTQIAGPVRSRRRGAVLEHALCTAAVEELIAVGYAGLTMEGVAARAHTGKAAVYRRWPNKRALTLDALRHVLPPLPQLDPSISARENLAQVFTALCGVLAGETPFPGHAVAIGLLAEPDLRAAFADAVVAPRLAVIASILARGEQTGEIAPGTLTPFATQVGPSLIMQTFLLTGAPPSPADIDRVIDTVLSLPA